jgi:hypothetical protein
MEGLQSELKSKTNPKLSQRPDVKVLSSFDTCRKASRHPPKKEYVRCKLIRGHKRAIRQILAGQKPKTTIHKFKPDDGNANSLWMILTQLILQELSVFQERSKTESGPITDGKSKRMSGNAKDSQRSFNGTFCKNYFESELIRESFSVYIDLIFSNFDPEVLCGKFEFRCCREENHGIECLQKWVSLLQYLKIDMIDELGLKPFDVFYSFVNLPGYTHFLESEEDGRI